MPKNNGVSVTYEGHTGIVENAAGEKFELDPTRDLAGNDNEGLQRPDDDQRPRPIDGPDQGPSENTDAATERDEAGENDESEGSERPSDGETSRESSRPPARSTKRTSSGPKSTAPATESR